MWNQRPRKPTNLDFRFKFFFDQNLDFVLGWSRFWTHQPFHRMIWMRKMEFLIFWLDRIHGMAADPRKLWENVKAMILSRQSSQQLTKESGKANQERKLTLSWRWDTSRYTYLDPIVVQVSPSIRITRNCWKSFCLQRKSSASAKSLNTGAWMWTFCVMRVVLCLNFVSATFLLQRDQLEYRTRMQTFLRWNGII